MVTLVDANKMLLGPASSVGRKRKRTLDLDGDCWIWNGTTNGLGYGLITRDGKVRAAHRYVYEQLVEEIPEGMVIDHLCRRKQCCNPAHLEPVTQQENTLRGTLGQRNS